MERESSSKARSAGNFSGSSSVGGGGRSAFKGGTSGLSQSFAQSSISAPPSRPTGSVWWEILAVAEAPCPRCRKMNFGTYFMHQPICYGCCMRGHIQRDCHSSHQSMGRGIAQPTSSAATTSAVPPPAQGTPAHVELGSARGGT
nr:uncharacterized protein LOC104103864 [Nicotiana tomentosiformis]